MLGTLSTKAERQIRNLENTITVLEAQNRDLRIANLKLQVELTAVRQEKFELKFKVRRRSQPDMTVSRSRSHG